MSAVAGANARASVYGVQVLIAGRQKQWRDEIAGQIRRAGYSATACDCGVDALTVLALGLPVDVLVADISLTGELCCSQLALEARALRPGLRIVLASEVADTDLTAAELMPDALLVARHLRDGSVASTVREALANRN
ncbi:histidine kinase [Methylobacterium durans]|uniref:histidine kinase n=1 Tax=Methylobacterium durans TaxID=2202825 RepID=UPI002B00125E|nr:histidine kinase [Methylobacterium durans]MEA1834532.1 histidine kinase [Methylobacterium durans]